MDVTISERLIMNPIRYEDLKSKSMKKITMVQLELLRTYHYQYNLLPTKIFEHQENLPKGLTKYMVVAWIMGIATKADPYHIRWVLDRCTEEIRFIPRR